MYPQTRSARLWLALTILSVAACTAEPRSTSPILTGSMHVAVTSMQGVKPAVAVTGPNGYNKTITSTQTLTDLPIGDYSVAADSVVQPDPVVGMLVDSVGIKGNPAAIQTGDTAKVTVTYALKSRTGALWVANNATGVVPEYAAAQLDSSGTPTPAESLSTHAGGVGGLAFDSKGNMWESDYTETTATLYMYSSAAIAGDSTTQSDSIVSSAINVPLNLAMDSQGDLWVADGNGALFEFTPSQLAAGGNQTPTLQVTSGQLGCPTALTFDASGNLWVADNCNDHILEYTASQLTTTGPTCSPAPAQCTPNAADTIGSNSTSIDTPQGLAFDSHGNLWVANGSGSTIVGFTPAQAASNGAPAPQVTITAPSGATLNGIAVDNSGSIWVSNAPLGGTGTLYVFTSAQIATTGSPTPAATITGALSQYAPAQLVFEAGSTIQAPSAARVRSVHRGVSRVTRVNPSLARAQRP
jgi:sugar lactone lactonase YvrE